LEEVGIIIKTKRPNNKKTNLYLLTDKGLALTPTLVELAIWSDRNLRDIHPTIVNGEKMEFLRNDKVAFASAFEQKIQQEKLATTLYNPPLLTLLLLSSIFRETSTKFTNWIILITILTFGALSCVYPDQALKNYFNVINIGHLIFMFGLQLIINQKTILEKLDAKKKPAHNNGYKI
jgi:hypothetical protein